MLDRIRKRLKNDLVQEIRVYTINLFGLYMQYMNGKVKSASKKQLSQYSSINQSFFGIEGVIIQNKCDCLLGNFEKIKRHLFI